MTKSQLKVSLNSFKSPAGVIAIINIVILLGNMTFASQLFPLVNRLNLFEQRLMAIEDKVNIQDGIIIPRGELDQRFTNIDNQLADIKDALRSASLR